MINPDHPRSAKLLFSKEELAPDERPQATKATQKQPKKVKPAQKKGRKLNPHKHSLLIAQMSIFPLRTTSSSGIALFCEIPTRMPMISEQAIANSMRSRQSCNPKDKKHPLKISISTASRMNLLMLTAERLLASVRSLPGKSPPHSMGKQQSLHRANPEPHLVK